MSLPPPLSQSSTRWRRMDRRECCKQRGHGGARAGSQWDNANQPGRHGHRWISHSLIDRRGSFEASEDTTNDCLLWEGKKHVSRASSLATNTHTQTQVILLVGWYTIISTLLAHNLIHCPTLQKCEENTIPPQNTHKNTHC